ncbi:hypothetical protein [Dermacoccus nishinomiyaensis]|uniref:hypothetical protein n=1 Tax=Dermacoccus nishinomiyaensis TaxID=1274 RepID=UPI001EF545F0|nr:hypothetical protein [Dermacoccus nishinomiyaensis]MCG7430540.1 hypothetical protein [Dermacoccus nishinomiyaensis]
MSASSLIFFVIIAVWAAYMLKHWVRRREDLATARTVDRFSEAMRMLERRTPIQADVSARADEPSRTILRPQVSVKGASRVTPGAPEGDAHASTAERAEVPTTRVPARLQGAAQGLARVPAALESPKVKLFALLGSFGFFVVTALLALLTLVPAWLPLLGLLATAGVVVWLRRSAIAARTATAASTTVRPVGVSAPARAASPARSSATVGATRVAVEAADTAVPMTKRSPLVAQLPERDVDAEPAVDVEPDVDAVARAQAEVFDAAAWAPVDVPRPTYTMKAKAEREPVEPAATVDEVDTRPLAARYENTPVEDLPFDGMALDEDYEELPQVYRAG